MDRSRQTSLTAATAIMAGGLVEAAAFIPFTIAHGPTSYNLGNEVLVGHASVGVHHGLHPPVAGGHGPLAAPRPGSGGTSHCDRGSLRHVRHDVPVRGHDRHWAVHGSAVRSVCPCPGLCRGDEHDGLPRSHSRTARGPGHLVCRAHRFRMGANGNLGQHRGLPHLRADRLCRCRVTVGCARCRSPKERRDSGADLNRFLRLSDWRPFCTTPRRRPVGSTPGMAAPGP